MRGLMKIDSLFIDFQPRESTSVMIKSNMYKGMPNNSCLSCLNSSKVCVSPS